MKISRLMCMLAVGCVLSADDLRILREEALRFDSAAARRAVDDLAKNPSYDVRTHRAAVEALTARRDRVVQHLNPTNAAGRAEAVALVRGYRAALLANPLLDSDRILCVRRRLGNPVWPGQEKGVPGGSDSPYAKRDLSRRLGLLGLNAHNHMDLNRTGFTNDIAVVSDLRGTPATSRTATRSSFSARAPISSFPARTATSR